MKGTKSFGGGYKSGDTIQFGAAIFAGILTSGATSIQFSIPLPKEIPSGLTATVTGNAGVRKVTGGYLINGDITAAGTVTARISGTNTVTVSITASTAFSETNNTPLSVASATSNGIKITFS